MAMELERFEPVVDGNPPVRINPRPAALSDELLSALKALLSEHPGESQVFLHIGERQVLLLPDNFAVLATAGLLAELRELLGSEAVTA